MNHRCMFGYITVVCGGLMARNDPQFNFRVPQNLLDKVRAEAQENRRSATAEMAVLLEDGFKWREHTQAKAAA